MAPVTSTHSPLLANLLKRLHYEKRADTSPSTVNGLIAGIVILSVIILGYATLKGIRWYYHRNTSPFQRRANGRRMGSKRSNGSSEARQGIMPEISITDNNYANFHALNSAKSNEFSPASSTKQQFMPLSSAGFKTPRLEWRPPTLALWSRSHPSTSASSLVDGTTSTTTKKAGRGDEEIAFPEQSYLDLGKPKEAGSSTRLFGLARVKTKKELSPPSSGNAGINSSLNSSVAPVAHRTGSQEAVRDAEKEATRILDAESIRGRSRGGVESPPLPPLPAPTPDPTAVTHPHHQHQRSKSNTKSDSGHHPHASASRPPSRATVKGSRLTNASIASNKRVSVPSPRVSSLYHSRMSSHSYTPASPGLPHPQIPPIPPMPILPAFLQQQNQQQQQQNLDRSSSVRTVRSLTTDSIGSARPGGHRTAASSTLLHDSTVPPSVASDTSAEETIGMMHHHDPTKGVDGKSLPRTMVVTATFTPSLSDELPLTIGETVCMVEEYIDGWCFVQRVKVFVKDASKVNPSSQAGAKGATGTGGIMVGVNGTIDPENTYTVPVEGDGNSGAVPRFCVSEWPLSIAAMLELIEQQGEELDVQHQDSAPITTSDQQPQPQHTLAVATAGVPPMSALPQSVAAPPPAIATTTARRPPAQPQQTSVPAPAISQPSVVQRLEVRRGPNDLNIPTPSDVPDSKFSSWGSMLPTGTSPMPGIYSTMQSNQHIYANSPLPLPSSAITSATTTPVPTPRIVLPPPPPPAVVLPSSQSLAPPTTKSPRKETVSALSNDSSTGPSDDGTSRTPSLASHVPPAPPPTSPAVHTPEEEEEDDGIKRVSKPPPAPRLSRFPPSPEEEAGVSAAARIYHQHQVGMLQDHQHQNGVGAGAGGASGAGGVVDPLLVLHSPVNIPRASERTVTMPPLPRRPTATDPNPEIPPIPNAANNNSNNSSSSKYGAPVANGNGVANNNGSSNNNAAPPMQWGSFGLPSALSSAMDTSVGTSVMGTSVGSKTPSTGRSMLSSSTISKRFTSFAGGPRERSGSNSSSGNSSLMNRPGGPGVVSFKALRTGSATANVGAVTTAR